MKTEKCVKKRMTVQKMKILEHLKSVKTHPTAEMVYNVVKKDIPSITLATVYRNLNCLSEDGKIVKLEINGEFRFDADMGKHQHCVCKKCGKILDVFQKEISEYALKKIKSTDFVPSGVQVIFYGNCKHENKRAKNNKRPEIVKDNSGVKKR